jgi:glutamate-1-semialdehyde 2,1-aminomutase
MDLVAPAGPVYQAGTLSGHPLSMAAGSATLAELTKGRYLALEDTAAELAHGLARAASKTSRRASVAQIGALLTVFFRASVPVNAEEAVASDRAAFARFFGSMLDQGVLLPPSPFEAWFPSMAHGRAEIEATIEAATTAFEEAAA